MINARIGLLGSALACLLLVACGEPFSVTVASWKVGSADVAGTITNTGAGCTDPEITLKFFDRNGAEVQLFTFGAGELASGQSRAWKTHMVGLLLVDSPVEPSVTSVSATAECADQH